MCSTMWLKNKTFFCENKLFHFSLISWVNVLQCFQLYKITVCLHLQLLPWMHDTKIIITHPKFFQKCQSLKTYIYPYCLTLPISLSALSLYYCQPLSYDFYVWPLLCFRALFLRVGYVNNFLDIILYLKSFPFCF